ncbi:Radical SAM domain-containing protein [Rhodopirellula maiorica SM1]|uniref:Radical SAM domain-containing protein n=1 Tax=Rhodopirellula maiorica SM1 TaxID=1265738 RepID=M5RZ37_9BACT|nr:Radical SAM domain-containing protein [Rhodopirellula maiorica SM1]
MDARRAYAALVEPECNANRQVVDVATIFLTNRECPFRCLMCDLWKNTLTDSVQAGDIPEQIRTALTTLPTAREIKLYNSGNFFDRRAIPVQDHAVIAELVRGFDTVIVENHPKFCNDDVLRFRDLVAPSQLEIAIGLETCHPEVLASLNKSMTLEDFDDAATWLHHEGIRTRVFLLQKPPFLDESEATDWSLRSLDYAFDRGVDCCVVIPTRSGNGMMERLAERGHFSPPSGASMERVAEVGIAKQKGRVFVDLWDAGPLFPCDMCRDIRIARLAQMNLTQRGASAIFCDACSE